MKAKRIISEFNSELKLKGFKAFQIENDSNAYPVSGGLPGKLYHLTAVDSGITLCHLVVASEQEGKPFCFNIGYKDRRTDSAERVYVGR
ncbi:MAG: hypothetical protein LUG18_09420 [Candidatus Azobacteroides sp.]|nr:hypothetical protein [Candidatus Azobacteroides sp.]